MIQLLSLLTVSLSETVLESCYFELWLEFSVIMATLEQDPLLQDDDVSVMCI